MDLFEVVKKRHSYRGGFTDAAVSREDLQKIVQAGLDAPSGCNAQTTRFVIIDDPKLLEQIRQMHPGNKAMQQAHAYIACIVDTQPPGVVELGTGIFTHHHVVNISAYCACYLPSFLFHHFLCLLSCKILERAGENKC